MPKIDKKQVKWMRWLVRRRHRNQKTSWRLLNLLCKHNRTIKDSSELQTLVIALIATSFSLWRAAFLAQHEGDGENALDHATEFLQTLVRDNAIAYAQDKNSREWTYFYYVNNARSRMRNLRKLNRKFEKEIVPKLKRLPHKNHLRDWDAIHRAVHKTVNRLEKHLA